MKRTKAVTIRDLMRSKDASPGMKRLAKREEKRREKVRTEFGKGLFQQLLYLAFHFQGKQDFLDAATEIKSMLNSCKFPMARRDFCMKAQKLGPLARTQIAVSDINNNNMQEILKHAMAHCIKMWAYGTKDHAYELTPSPILSPKVNKMVEQLRAKMLYMGSCVPQNDLSVCTFKNVDWIRDRIGQIANHIDRHFLKIKGADRGQWR